MENIDVNDKIVFIIAHKYIRGHATYLKYYTDNIKKYYPHALTIVVDNNSNHVDEIFQTLEQSDRLVLLTNNIDCKFEIGAYRVGMRYLIDNNILDDYKYIACTQDTFVLKNKYDFNILNTQNTTACTINSFHQDGLFQHASNAILAQLGLDNNLDKITFCWCNSFIIATTKVHQLMGYFEQLTIQRSVEREVSERYLARILWELNDYTNTDIDGNISNLDQHYNCHTVDIVNATTPTYFVKRAHQRTENTPDQW